MGAGDMILRGFHPTAVFGAFGATAACARLLDFTPKQLAGAWGLVLSLAGGSMQFSREAEGTTVKRLHAAFAAQNGILACELTEHGLEGPLSALDGDFGVARLFGPSPDLERLAQKPARAAIHGVSFKPYPCCRLFHSTLDALAQVTDAFTLDPARIAGLEVTGPRLLVEQHMLRRPASTMAAQYQLPYTLAAALFFGPQNEDGFAAAARADPRLAAIEDKVTAERDDEFDAAFPRHFGSSTSMTLTNGEVRQARVLDSLGTPVNPLSDDALTEKTRGLLFAAGASVTADALRQACRVLVERSDPSHLMQALAHG